MTDNPLALLILLACLAVLVVLLMGINSFRKDGSENRSRSNILMRWRIGLQFLAVLLIIAVVAYRRSLGG